MRNAAALLLTLPLLAAPPQVGRPAPDFQVQDAQGRALSLSALKGKVVVLEWTNPGCPFVQRHYGSGSLPALQAQAAAQGAVWITIDSTARSHRDFLDGQALRAKLGAWKAAPAHVVVDPEGSLGRAYEAKTTPHLFVIDGQGRVAYMGAVDDDPRGGKSERQVYPALALEALRAGRPLSVTSTAPYGCSVKYR